MSACIEWTGRKNEGGYGRIGPELAHRRAWERRHGKIPKPPGRRGSVDICVLHLCDNRACVNVDHLRLGTQQENVADCIAKGRQSSQHGELNPRAKLTWAEVETIRNLFAARCFTRPEIQRYFSIPKSTLHNILKGYTWKR